MGKKKELVNSIARLLLDAGAHLDSVNNQGETAVDVWKRENKKNTFDWLKDDGGVPKLKCLTARVIHRQKVSHLDKLPVSLQVFIRMH